MIRKSNTNLIKLVEILNDGEEHDGTSLGHHLGMTRSAVWKMIKKLQNYGVVIDSSQGSGYRMPEPIVLLDAIKIKKMLHHKKAALDIFECIASTNDYLQSIKQAKEIQFCFAEQQTAGKGRLGRDWYSPFGRNLYFSCLYPMQKDVSELAGLSLVVSLSILKTLAHFCDEQYLKVKWPNDVMCDGEKISGALMQVHAESHGHCHVVIGIGINVNMQDDKRQISQAWTSLQKITGKVIDRNALAATLINYLMEDLAQFTKQGFVSFVKTWKQYDYLRARTITLKNINQKVSGVVEGVDEYGHLQLSVKGEGVRSFAAGDTSIEK